jgi:hypothetical protein
MGVQGNPGFSFNQQIVAEQRAEVAWLWAALNECCTDHLPQRIDDHAIWPTVSGRNNLAIEGSEDRLIPGQEVRCMNKECELPEDAATREACALRVEANKVKGIALPKEVSAMAGNSLGGRVDRNPLAAEWEADGVRWPVHADEFDS